MPDFDSMTHEELARYADVLRADRERATTPAARARIDAEMAELDAAARRRPQQITGTMG